MSQIYVLLGSLAGIAMLVGLSAIFGRWSRPVIQSPADAAAFMKAEYFRFEPGEAVLAPDGGAAIVADVANESFGVIVTRGDRWVARVVTPQTVRQVKLTRPERLRIGFRDFTMPSAVIAFEDAQTAQRWAERLTRALDAAQPSADAHERLDPRTDTAPESAGPETAGPATADPETTGEPDHA